MVVKKQALGRGLAALLGDEESTNLRTDKSQSEHSTLGSNGGQSEVTASAENPKHAGADKLNEEPVASPYREISLTQIHPNVDQPRKHIENESLEELAASIRKYGVLQPIILLKPEHDAPNPQYQIIAGERRWRAAKIAGLDRIPAIIHAMSSKINMEVALVENIQRVQLSSLEEAMAYENLIELYGFSQEKLAATLGKSRSHITNMLRLNKLDPAVKKALQDGKISYGHARCLVNIAGAEDIVSKIATQNLSVRETEKLVQETNQQSRSYKSSRPKKKHQTPSSAVQAWQPEEITQIEATLREHLQSTVHLVITEKEKKIVIYFEDYNQFDDILKKVL